MLANVVAEFEGHMPLVGEIQIHYRPILELKEAEVRLPPPLSPPQLSPPLPPPAFTLCLQKAP